jgi:hypothetical protein
MSEDNRQTKTESDSLTWEEQRDEIQRLNAKALKHAAGLIDGTTVEQKGTDREGDPLYTEVSDGVDMLARCSTIAKQWMSEIRQGSGGPVEPTDTDSLMRKAKKVL